MHPGPDAGQVAMGSERLLSPVAVHSRHGWLAAGKTAARHEPHSHMERLERKVCSMKEEGRLTRKQLEAQIWKENLDVAFAGVDWDDFDRLTVDLYDANGYPYLDEFEYIDAGFQNRAVEARFQEYARWRKAKEADGENGSAQGKESPQ